jgi:phosphate transport system substrate-binding protein
MPLVKSMKATVKKLALALGTLALGTSCTTTSNTRVETQLSPVATEVINAQTVSQILIDGSSTVYPITSAIANKFQLSKSEYKGQVSVNFSGTTAGFKKFCAKKTDISNASRPILKDEIEACNKNGVKFIEIPVASDALTVVVNTQNTWAKDMTTQELKKIWEPAAQGKITRWKQVRPSWPDKPINLYGAGKDSGTFDYFTEAIVGKVGSSRTDYSSSEDDTVLVSGMVNVPNALGYFGFVYYQDNKAKLNALAINSGKGAVLPSREGVEKSQYQPLSRPLFIYVNTEAVHYIPKFKEFIEHYLNSAPSIISSVGYVPLPVEAYELAKSHFYKGKEGSLFGGKEQLDLTIKELLRREEEK